MRGARVNTDDHPYLEFTPAFAYFVSKAYLVQNLTNLSEYREIVLPLLVNTGESEAEAAAVKQSVLKRFQAAQHSIDGDIHFYMGRPEQAKGEYNTALLIDPGEKNWAHPLWRGEPGPR